jgi:hypothetical protein
MDIAVHKFEFCEFNHLVHIPLTHTCSDMFRFELIIAAYNLKILNSI